MGGGGLLSNIGEMILEENKILGDHKHPIPFNLFPTEFMKNMIDHMPTWPHVMGMGYFYHFPSFIYFSFYFLHMVLFGFVR